MLYPLFIKLNAFCDTAILAIVYIKYLIYWRVPLLFSSKKPVDVLCIYDKRYSHITDYIQQNIAGNVFFCELKNASNSKIIERAYVLTKLYKPKSIFVIFENMNVVDVYRENGDILSLSYDLVPRNTFKYKQYQQPTYIIILFLRFIYDFLFLKALCISGKQTFFWSYTGSEIKILLKLAPDSILTDSETNIFISYIADKHILESAEQTARKFVLEYNNRYV